jgi:hypothetical protein
MGRGSNPLPLSSIEKLKEDRSSASGQLLNFKKNEF